MNLSLRLSSLIAIVWSLVQLYNAVTWDLDLFEIEVVHITFALMLVFLLRPSKKNSKFWLITDYTQVFLSLASGLYFFLSYERIIARYRFVDPVLWEDYFFGGLLILLIWKPGED